MTEKAKNTSGRNSIPHLSRKCQMPPQDWEAHDAFYDNIHGELKGKRSYGIRINGKWVYKPEGGINNRKDSELYQGKHQGSCRSEGSDG